MASHLVDDGVQVCVWNRTVEKANAFANKRDGATAAATSSECLSMASETIISALFSAQNLKEVVDGSADGVLDSKTIINTSTISPKEALELKAAIEAKNGKYVESTVLGNNKVAENKALKVLFGGEKEEFTKYERLLQNFGTVKYVGPVGKATACKLALNQMLASLLVSFSTTLGVLENYEVPIDIFLDTMITGPIKPENYLPKWTERMTNREYDENPTFKLGGMKKDVSLFRELADSVSVDCSYLDGLVATLSKNPELQNSDFSAVYEGSN
eukprot:CAMPEP_0174261698 /NCGR_PEP_ID=MMETSP0439-20130205/11868_1 /TAXON_ID=0 /ORGANISM="Stereomyxa ramosa, Strain Chinc5" /LENGTH=271 /DNA_ID=CAMNT_0015346229 /DNA_START=72 /DNA_END=884 /DNA_ORIENTATION=+